MKLWISAATVGLMALAMPALAAAPCKDARGKFVKCPPVAAKPIARPAAKPMVAAAGTRCRDAKGKFIACTTKPAPAPVRCKDAKGKFTKCGTPGAKPA